MRKNTTESRNGSWFNFDKFITGYETCFYKNSLQIAKFIAKYKSYGLIKKQMIEQMKIM